MTADAFAETPKPPFFAVIFTSRHSATDERAYAETADRMMELAANQNGYLGIESVRDSDGTGITVSYWRDEESIQSWYRNAEHQEAQRAGKEKWYDAFHVRIARVERQYSFAADTGRSADATRQAK